MKGTIIAILLILVALSGANASRAGAVDATTSTKDPSWWTWMPWWRFWFHPVPHWPYHPIPPSPSPSKLAVDPDTQKCLGDVAGAESCFHQISESYNTQTISLSQACCTTVQQLGADCSSTVFSKFNNPSFENAIKQC